MQSANEATNIDRFYEAIANMEAQLVAMYQEQNELGLDLGEAKSTIESMENQLVTLYSEKEALTGDGIESMQEALKSMEHQLVELYKQREHSIAAEEAVESMEHQLADLYKRQEHAHEANEIIADLEGQIRTLELKLKSASGDESMFEMVESLENQLCDLYEAQDQFDRMPGGDIISKAMAVMQQNIILSQENAQLRIDMAHKNKELVDTQVKLKEWSSALLQTAFKA